MTLKMITTCGNNNSIMTILISSSGPTTKRISKTNTDHDSLNIIV